MILLTALSIDKIVFSLTSTIQTLMVSIPKPPAEWPKSFSDLEQAATLANFTHIWTAEGWLYAAAAMDLFSRRVVPGPCSPA